MTRPAAGGTSSGAVPGPLAGNELKRMISKINDTRATVLVGLGAGPQEKFIVRCRDRMPHVKMFLPLGGTIDYEAKTLRRPPSWVTNAGLE